MSKKQEVKFLAKGARPAAIQNDAAMIKKFQSQQHVTSFQSGLDVLEKLFPYIALPPTPTVSTFFPLHISPGMDERIGNEQPPIPHGKLSGGICQLVGSPSAAILTRDIPSAESWVRSDKKPTSTLFMTSKGVRESKSSMNAELVNSVVKFEHIDIACRASILGATSANFAREIFFFDLSSSSSSSGAAGAGKGGLLQPTQSSAITYELDLNKGSKVTACAVADIAILLPASEKVGKGLIGSGPPKDVLVPHSSSSNTNNLIPPQPPTVIGVQALMLIGDSDGRVHYCIATKAQPSMPSGPASFTVLQSSSWTAHKAPIVALATRADAVRPLWRIAVTLNNGLPQPAAAPGSAVISLARNGEVNIWQPDFTTSTAIRSKPELVLTVFTPQFHLSGTFLMTSVSDVPHEVVEVEEVSIAPKATKTKGKKNRKGSNNASNKGDGVRSAKGGEGAVEAKAEPVPVPVVLPPRNKYPTGMAVDPSCQHLIVTFDEGSTDIWPILVCVRTTPTAPTAPTALTYLPTQLHVDMPTHPYTHSCTPTQPHTLTILDMSNPFRVHFSLIYSPLSIPPLLFIPPYFSPLCLCSACYSPCIPPVFISP